MNFSTFVFFIVWPWYEFLYQILHYTQIPVYVLMQLFVVSVQHLLCILIYCIIDIFLALKSVKKCMWVFRVHKIMCIRVMHFLLKNLCHHESFYTCVILKRFYAFYYFPSHMAHLEPSHIFTVQDSFSRKLLLSCYGRGAEHVRRRTLPDRHVHYYIFDKQNTVKHCSFIHSLVHHGPHSPPILTLPVPSR